MPTWWIGIEPPAPIRPRGVGGRYCVAAGLSTAGGRCLHSIGWLQFDWRGARRIARRRRALGVGHFAEADLFVDVALRLAPRRVDLGETGIIALDAAQISVPEASLKIGGCNAAERGNKNRLQNRKDCNFERVCHGTFSIGGIAMATCLTPCRRRRCAVNHRYVAYTRDWVRCRGHNQEVHVRPAELAANLPRWYPQNRAN